MRTDPKPKDFVRSAESADRTVVSAYTDRNEAFRRVDALEVETWMSRIGLEELVRRNVAEFPAEDPKRAFESREWCETSKFVGIERFR